MSKADFAVSHAGASTLWEMCANSLPAFLYLINTQLQMINTQCKSIIRQRIVFYKEKMN